jgi:hypothetical protein
LQSCHLRSSLSSALRWLVGPKKKKPRNLLVPRRFLQISFPNAYTASSNAPSISRELNLSRDY